MNQSLTYGSISTAVSKQRDPCLSEMQEAGICQLVGGEMVKITVCSNFIHLYIFLSAYKTPLLPSTALQKKKILIIQVYI